jgi:hydroxyacylglutathione hydrolase
LREPEAVSAAGLETWVGDGAVALDLREPEAFAGAHVPGSLNVALGSSFPTWAGTVLPEGARVVLVTDDPTDVPEATWELLRIGYEPPVAWLAGGVRTWRTSAKPFARLASISAAELRDRRQDYVVLDVRQPAEWSAGRIAGSQLLTGAELPARLDEVPRDRPVAVLCGSGFRSSVAASLLQASGHEVVNVLGGISAWRKAGLPLER